ncbi:squalene synthase 8-like isoform X2 [Andrographis paniculata]|uniref:squalene synthase 8-like isoform X2 n=1 Tax=Andrographis paniculata TaxID=175694 RepID=UPI0021E7F275|nr:squalene synthase 8-like isoform X2 [Andrographis paniculata]
MFAAVSSPALQFGGQQLSSSIGRKRSNLKVESLRSIWRHPDELCPMVRLKLASIASEMQIPAEPRHWQICYSMLAKLEGRLVLIHHLHPHVRDAICIFYLVLRALDTIEDDTSIAAEIKLPLLQSFHSHIRDKERSFSCGTKDEKVLMEEFHHVSAAFLDLDPRYQEIIEEIAKRMGEGMAKFICKKIDTLDEYDEYCYYVAGLVGIGMAKVLHVSGKEELVSDDISEAMGVLGQKLDIITDYLDDINAMPTARMFWPRQIWSKYVDKLEDLKEERNSAKALFCLNEMVTNALVHVESSLNQISSLRDPAYIQFYAIVQVIIFRTLALCYNNIQVFNGTGINLRGGIAAKLFYKTRTKSDVYQAFYDISYMLKSKVDSNDPNAGETHERLDAIIKICRNLGTIKERKSFTSIPNNLQAISTLVPLEC